MAGAKDREKIPIEWEVPDGLIISANVFRFIYGPEAVVFAIGAVDPEYTIEAVKAGKEKIKVKPIQRYILTITDFLRLKEQLEQAYEGLKSKGIKL